MLVAVDDVGFGSFLKLRINQNILDDILDIFNARQAFLVASFQYRQHLVGQFDGLFGVKFASLQTRLLNGFFNFFTVKFNSPTIAFFD